MNPGSTASQQQGPTITLCKLKQVPKLVGSIFVELIITGFGADANNFAGLLCVFIWLVNVGCGKFCTHAQIYCMMACV